MLVQCGGHVVGVQGAECLHGRGQGTVHMPEEALRSTSMGMGEGLCIWSVHV